MSVLGRYLQMEPLLKSPAYLGTKTGAAERLVAYAYAENNPVIFYDLDGLQTCQEGVEVVCDPPFGTNCRCPLEQRPPKRPKQPQKSGGETDQPTPPICKAPDKTNKRGPCLFQSKFPGGPSGPPVCLYICADGSQLRKEPGADGKCDGNPQWPN